MYHSGGIKNTDYLISGFEILQVTCTWVNTKAIKNYVNSNRCPKQTKNQTEDLQLYQLKDERAKFNGRK